MGKNSALDLTKETTMPKSRKQPYKAKLQEFIRLYREQVHEGPVTMREVADWAIQEGLWRPPTASAVDQLARELSAAARTEFVTDPQGRRVRRMHARRMEVQSRTGEMKQETFWDDIQNAAPEHMHMAFQQRRRLVLSDCHQLQIDVASYNDNWNTGEQLILSFDFTEDLEELSMPPEYPKSPEDKDEEDDSEDGEKL
jgi:hypothetical protein